MVLHKVDDVSLVAINQSCVTADFDEFTTLVIFSISRTVLHTAEAGVIGG